MPMQVYFLDALSKMMESRSRVSQRLPLSVWLSVTLSASTEWDRVMFQSVGLLHLLNVVFLQVFSGTFTQSDTQKQVCRSTIGNIQYLSFYATYYKYCECARMEDGEHRIFHPWGWFPLSRISSVHSLENSIKVLEHVWFPPPKEPVIDKPVLIPDVEGVVLNLLDLSEITTCMIAEHRKWSPTMCFQGGSDEYLND